MRFFFLFLILFFFSFALYATHNRAGEITYEHLDNFRNRVTITTYTKTSGISINADRPVLDSVPWGAGQVSPFFRDSLYDSPGLDVRYNRYRGIPSYPGSGVFEIS